MGPIVKELAAGYSDKSIKFVTFDFTSADTKSSATAQADALGVAGTYAQNAPNTGFALVYDTKTQKVVAKLSASDETSKWREVIDGSFGS